MIIHVEIPVKNLERAMEFYGSVFEVTFSDVVDLHGNRMAYFPFTEGQEGASVALAEGDIYKPSHEGAVVYFDVKDIEATLQRRTPAYSKTLFAKSAAGEGIFVAEIEDSEGNRIGLQQMQR